MNLFFSDKPGSHERHLRRKVNNPLFGDLVITQDEILAARAKDETEFEAFMEDFHAIARDASALDPSVDADVLIELKSRLEKNYDTSCYIMGNPTDIREGLSRLIESIMTTLLHASQQEEDAYQKLVDEKAAREVHFELLTHVFIADLIRPDSPIQSDELMPALLSEQDKVVQAAMLLFTDEQLVIIYDHGSNMLDGVDSSHERISHAIEMLHLLKTACDASGAETRSSSGNGLAS